MRISDWSSDVCSSDLRIIDEAEFVDYASYRRHYETTVERIRQRLADGAARSEIRPDAGEIHAWAIAGMNVFLGMRYGLWDRSEEHTSELQSLMRISYAVFCLKKKKKKKIHIQKVRKTTR